VLGIAGSNLAAMAAATAANFLLHAPNAGNVKTIRISNVAVNAANGSSDAA
jgi:hypothetical protein